MAVSLTPNGLWLQGDTPDGGTAACLARTIIAAWEELISGTTYRTWVRTDQAVATPFAGKQASAIYLLIKDIVT